MRSSQVIPPDAADQFWSVVRCCIREFHGTRPAAALAKATRLRKKVERLPVEQMELFYHDEPFDLACRLAGRPLRVEDHLERYLELRDRQGERCC